MSLISTFQVQYNGARVITAPSQFYPIPQIVIFLPNEDSNDTIINFTLQGIVAIVKIRTPSDEDPDILTVNYITISLFLVSNNKMHAENEVEVHQGAGISKR